MPKVPIVIAMEPQVIIHRFEGTRNVFILLDDAWSRYYNYRQGQDQTLHDYLKKIEGLVQVLEHYGASIGTEEPLKEYVKEHVTSYAPDSLSTGELELRILTAAKNRYLAVGFLKRADKKKYGALWRELENSYTVLGKGESRLKCLLLRMPHHESHRASAKTPKRVERPASLSKIRQVQSFNMYLLMIMN